MPTRANPRKRSTVSAILAATVVLFVSSCAGVTDSGPTPSTLQTLGTSTLTVSPRVGAEHDAQRLDAFIAPGTDLQPTGLYLPPNHTLTVQLELNGTGDGLPSLAVGAPNTMLDPEATEETNWWQRALRSRISDLNEGENTVSDPHGGPLYIVWRSENHASTSQATLTFGEGTQKMATFTLGETTPEAFRAHLDQLTTPFVELYSERAMITLSRSQMLTYRSEDQHALMTDLDRLINIEDRITGYDSSGPQHVGPAGPHHLVGYPGNVAEAGGWADPYHTVYTEGMQNQLLDLEELRLDGWGVYHELGHQHQQAPVTPNELIEVGVNIYSLAVQREFTNLYGQLPRLRVVNEGGTSHWDNAMAAQAAGVEDFSDLEVFARVVPFEQLRLAYGEEVLSEWHKVVREQNLSQGNGLSEPARDNLRWQNVVLTTSIAAGADLSGFWTDWGVSVETATVNAIANLGLTPPTQALTSLRESNVQAPANAPNSDPTPEAL